MNEGRDDRDAPPAERFTWVPGGRGIDLMLRDDGFAVVPGLATAAEASAVRAALTAVAPRLDATDRRIWRNPQGTSQIAWASRLVPDLSRSPIRSAARALAAEIVGGRVVERFDYALVTPPGAPGAPWHRDEESFALSRVDRRVHVWVALQNTDESNGCLHYVPRQADADRREKEAINCPTPAGTGMVHDQRTLHCSGRNETGEPRWAWILQFVAANPFRDALFALDRARASVLLRRARLRLAATTTPARCYGEDVQDARAA